MKISCTIMRGGTSKGIILRQEDLPDDLLKRDEIILRIFGSPDRRQIDGMGGADPLTSKLAIIGKSTHVDADLDYTYGQVEIVTPGIDYDGYCGNITTAVAAYAVDEKLVDITSPVTEVRIHNKNTGRVIIGTVPVINGKRLEAGEFRIDGVPGSGARINLDFAQTAGSTTGSILPTGNPIDRIRIEGLGEIRFSVVEMANPVIFVDAAFLNIFPTDGPEELNNRKDLFLFADRLRNKVAEMVGLDRKDGSLSENLLVVCMINKPHDYISFSTRKTVYAEFMDLWSREIFLGTIHKTHGVAETICTAAAAVIPGTIVYDAARPECKNTGMVRIGHPCGIIEAMINVVDGPVCTKAVVGSTARRIMDGEVYIPDR